MKKLSVVALILAALFLTPLAAHAQSGRRRSSQNTGTAGLHKA